jgi:hypothetical protein
MFHLWYQWATGSSMSSIPASACRSAKVAVAIFVIENHGAVSSVDMGVFAERSAHPVDARARTPSRRRSQAPPQEPCRRRHAHAR